MSIKVFQKVMLIMAGIIVAVVCAEIFLRYFRPHNYFSVRSPNMDVVEEPLTHFFPGLDSVIHYTTNEYGYRSSSYFAPNKYGVLTLGGSTTECVCLDDTKTWPFLLEKKLNYDSIDVVVGNVGRASLNSAHHYLQLKYLEPQYGNIKMIVVLVGVNDYLRFLNAVHDYVPTNASTTLMKESFMKYPRYKAEKWYQNTELWMHVRDAKQKLRTKYTNKNQLDYINNRIEVCSSAHLIDSLPNMDRVIADYEINLLKIISLAKERKLKLVFLTQPTLWKEGLDTVSFKYAYATSNYSKGEIYSPKACANGMKQLNASLIRVAKQQSINVIDLATILPKDTTIFFDFCHFNNHGTEKVSRLLADSLSPIIKADGKFSN